MAAAKKEKKDAPVPSKKPEPQVVADPMSAVVIRNSYYRDGFRRMLAAAYFGSMAIVALIVVLVGFINLHEKRDRYFVTTSDGKVIEMTSLDEAGLTQQELGEWVTKAVSDTMSFGYSDYKQKLQAAAPYFTKNGWDGFTAMLQQAKLVQAVESQQQTVTAKPAGQLALLEQGVGLDGRYFWHVKLPLGLTYQAGSKSSGAVITLDLIVVRAPSLEKPQGVSIDRWTVVAG